jgi:TfoX/Sxy family transcriptional regulator of competence genes
MAINEKLTNRVRVALEQLPKVEEKKMFTGITFMVNGKMCVSVGNDRLMCRIDPILHDDLVGKDGCRSVLMKGRELKGYVYVNEEYIKTKKLLQYWIDLVLDFNARAIASKKKKRDG